VAEEGGQKDESKDERLDRELIELLNELRVALPGVQVLFAFMLTVPFSQRFPELTDLQRDAYFAAFLCATTAVALLISPTAMHRIEFRARDKERMIVTANRFAIAGTIALAAAMSLVVFVITDVLFGTTWASFVTAAVVLIFVALWYVLPLKRRLEKRRET
jgi:hypothetical protein